MMIIRSGKILEDFKSSLSAIKWSGAKCSDVEWTDVIYV